MNDHPSLPHEPEPNEKWAAQLRKGTLELAVLSALGPQSRYGLELISTLQEAGLGITEGTLYPLLNRLRNEGLLSSEWRQEGTGNPRKYYALTERGQQRTADMVQAWDAFSGVLNRLIRDSDQGARHAR